MTLLTSLNTLATLLPVLGLPASGPAQPTLAQPQRLQPALVSAQAAAMPSNAYLLLLAARRDTRQSLSMRYGVPPEAVQLDAALTQPALTQPLAGRVVRVALPLTPSEGRTAPGIRKVTVRPGDTLSRVEARYNLSESELISANLHLSSLDKLTAGDTLNIPTGTRGLLLTIKAGQDAAGLIEAYHASPLWTARVNHFTLPTELRPGDQLLLPGIFAKNRHEELLARRERAIRQAQQAQVLRRYNAFLAWKAEREHQRQVQYQRYQAWLSSPQRLAMIAKYKRQAAYETWEAHEARAQLAALAREQVQAQLQAKLQAQEQAQREAQEQAQQAQAQQELRTQLAKLSASDPRPQMQAAAQAEAAAPALAISWPVDHPRLTSGFGEEDITFHQELFHGGQDMAAAEGTPIYAAASGTVTQSGMGGYGLNVYVQHTQPSSTPPSNTPPLATAPYTMTYIYGHMVQASVQAGQQVKQGDLLGYVGCTGMCTGPHLHFEMRLNGVAIDPMLFLPQDHTAKINVVAAPLQLASLQAAHSKLSARATPKVSTLPLKSAVSATAPARATDTTSAAAGVVFMPPASQQSTAAQSATPAGTQ